MTTGSSIAARTRLDIQVLGPLRVTVCGIDITPSAAKQRQVLALLAVNAGQVVTPSVMIDEVWGDRPPRVPLGSLQTYILQLRKQIDRALADDEYSAKDVLLTAHTGYLLRTSPDTIDARRYERLVAAGRQAIGDRDYVTGSRTLSEALDMWRGRAFVDVTVGRQLQVERTRLEESCLSIVDSRIEADLRLGRHRMVLDELAALCLRHPFSENFHAQYMVALHRSGLPWRALEVYRRLNNTVVENLGVDPSRRLQRLHQAVLAGDPILDDPRFVAADWQPMPATHAPAARLATK